MERERTISHNVSSRDYEPPMVECVSVAIEQGFASSEGKPDQPERVNEFPDIG